MVIFARQDLVLDPPFLHLDLISCRNVLIYFQNELQARILATFHFALRNGGMLFFRPLRKCVTARGALYGGR